jgi:hypothetical protein
MLLFGLINSSKSLFGVGVIMNKLLTTLVVLTAAMGLKSADAGLVLSFGTAVDAGTNAVGPFSPTDSIKIPVFASLEVGDANRPLSAFGIGIDFAQNTGFLNGNDFVGAPDLAPYENFTFSNGLPTGAISSATNAAPFLPFDLLVSLNSATETLTGGATPTQVTLFDIEFDITAGAASGIYQIGFDSVNAFGSTNFTGFLATELNLNAVGTFEIVGAAAVPEPSTFGLMAMGCIGFGWHRRRKARQANVATV